MSAFEHVVVLLSFVFALALTHLLSRVGAFIVGRKRVRPSGLLALAIVNAVVMVFQNWLLLWTIRGWSNIDLLGVTVIFGFSLTLYFICAVAAPEAVPGEPIDLEAFYWETYRPYYALAFLLTLFSFAVNAIYLKTSTPQMFMETNLASVPGLLPSILAFAVKARWAQWASGILLLVVDVAFLVFFAGSLT